jgi:hypothetical protein
MTARTPPTLAGKIIVDISNPFNSAADGLATREDTSIAIGALAVAGGNTAGDDAQAKAEVEAFRPRGDACQSATKPAVRTSGQDADSPRSAWRQERTLPWRRDSANSRQSGSRLQMRAAWPCAADMTCK